MTTIFSFLVTGIFTSGWSGSNSISLLACN